MKNVLTLIANSNGAGLDGEAVALAHAALIETGVRAGGPVWLAEGVACDIPFEGMAPDEADETVRQYLRDAPIDIVAQPAARRRKKLLVADMDSTMIEVESIDELAGYMDLRAEVSEITLKTMRGELDFDASLRARAAMLKGLKASVLGRAFNDRIVYASGAHRLVRTMRANGAYTVLVSGGFSYFTERVRLALGFSAAFANDLAIVDGVVTGRVGEPILGPGAKLDVLERTAAELDIDLIDTMAVGDGANDVTMIQAAGLGVAYHGKPQVAMTAKARINHGDLTAMLYIQGYRTDAIVD